MKLKFLSILSVLMLTIGLRAYATDGWPANYEGVMLQGFYWDSYEETKWTTLESKADEYSKYFDLIWVPNSAHAASNPGMGYDPVYWFTNHNSSFGTEDEIRRLIKTYKAKGVGIIEDVVVNHRSGVTDWTDFPSEKWNNQTWFIGLDGICCDDEVKDQPGQPKPTGNPDSGDNFGSSRDLDHRNTNVQNNVKNYCKFLLEDMGYAGFRLDMVKGYDGKFTKIYNQYSNPTYSVGEYWDDQYDNVARWIDATGRTSAAFDFPGKYQLNKAMNGGGENLKELVWNAYGVTPQPAGMIHCEYGQHAVTFVDNHDTYRDNSKFTGNVLAANAFILCSPGTPCVFLRHYMDHTTAIQELINARKKVGVHNCSPVTILASDNDIYMAEVTGTKGKLVVKIGSEWGTGAPEGYEIATSGENYCVWTKTEGGVTPTPTPGGGSITIYYDNTNTKFSPVNCYSFNGDKPNNGDWPGKVMTAVSGTVYSATIPAGSSGVVFNAGIDKPQTVDVLNVKDGYIYTGAATQNSEGKYAVDAGKPYDGNGNNNPGTEPAPTADLYLHGNFGNHTDAWDPTAGLSMTKEPGHYTLRNLQLNGATGNAFFSFADRKGEWDYVNGGTRYGADSEDMTVAVGQTVSITAGNWAAWQIANGTYDLVINSAKTSLTIYAGGTAPKFDEGGNEEGGDDPVIPTPNPSGNLYIMGDLEANGGWFPNKGLAMSVEGGKFVARNVAVQEAYENTKGYFSFSDYVSALEGKEGWDDLNGKATRYGVAAENAPLSLNTPTQLVPNKGDIGAFEVDPGKYDIVVDPSNWTVTLYTGGTAPDYSGLDTLAAAENTYSISTFGGSVRIEGLTGQKLVVAGIDGRVYYHGNAWETVEVYVGRGVFIVVVDNSSTKLVVR